MNAGEVLLATMRDERRMTRAAIADIPEDALAYRPTPEQMSLGGQALHIIACQETLLEALQTGRWEWDRGLTLERFRTREAILARFDEMNAAQEAYFGGLEPEQLGRPVQTAWGSKETVLQLALSFLAHDAHHRGQIVTYLRLKGIKPAVYM